METDPGPAHGAIYWDTQDVSPPVVGPVDLDETSMEGPARPPS